ncbi:hypothetical protein ACFL4W_04445 [Planctomycetota bacterium]
MKSKLIAIVGFLGSMFLGMWGGILGWDTARGGPVGLMTSMLFCTVLGLILMFSLWPNTDRGQKLYRKKLLKHRKLL